MTKGIKSRVGNGKLELSDHVEVAKKFIKPFKNSECELQKSSVIYQKPFRNEGQKDRSRVTHASYLIRIYDKSAGPDDILNLMKENNINNIDLYFSDPDLDFPYIHIACLENDSKKNSKLSENIASILSAENIEYDIITTLIV